MKELGVFRERLSKIGIDVSCSGNFPWVYIDKINGNKVKEKHNSEHGFVVGYAPIRLGSKFTFETLSEIFKIIRKYINNGKI